MIKMEFVILICMAYIGVALPNVAVKDIPKHVARPVTQHYVQPLFLVEGREVSQRLFVSNPYPVEYGEWANPQVCPNASFASGIAVRYQEPGGLLHPLRDETAINAIKLYCMDKSASYEINTGYATSMMGTKGEWYDRADCNRGYVTGFRANVLPHHSVFGSDNVAIEDFEVECNREEDLLDPLPIEVPGLKTQRNFDAGVWSDLVTCVAGSYVCGLQTRFDGGFLGDETAIADVVIYCCFANSKNVGL